MQEKIDKKNMLSQIIILEAITLGIFMLIGYSPLIAITSIFLLPISVAILYVKSTLKTTVGLLIVNTILVFTIVGNISSCIIALITCGGLGITLGLCIKKRKKATTSIFILIGMTILITVINSVIVLVFIEKKSIITIISEVTKYLDEIKESTKEIYKNNFGFTSEQLSTIDSIMNTKEILQTIPGVMIVIYIISSFFNYIITAKILYRMNIKVNKLKSFTKFYVSNLLGAALIILTCIGVIIDSRNIEIGQYIYKTTITILEFIFVMNGAAAIAHIIRNKFKKSKIGTILIIVFSIVIFQKFYMIVGLGEMIVDFRKLDPRRIFKKKLGK